MLTPTFFDTKPLFDKAVFLFFPRSTAKKFQKKEGLTVEKKEVFQ